MNIDHPKTRYSRCEMAILEVLFGEWFKGSTPICHLHSSKLGNTKRQKKDVEASSSAVNTCDQTRSGMEIYSSMRLWLIPKFLDRQGARSKSRLDPVHVLTY